MEAVAKSLASKLRELPVFDLGKSSYYRACSLLGRRLTGKNPLTARLRAERHRASVITVLQAMRRRADRTTHDYHDMLKESVSLSYRFDSVGDAPLLQKIVNTTPLEQTSEAIVGLAGHLEVPLRASFRANLTLRSKRLEHTTLPEWAVNEKDATEDFATLIDVPHPRVRERGARFHRLELRANTVVKPCSGSASNGVFLVFARDAIVELNTGRRFSHWSTVNDYVQAELSADRIRHDEWIVEDLIVGPDDQPARDIKCFTFYGHVAMVLEMRRCNGGVQYRCLDRSGRVLDTGRYTNTLTEPTNWLDEAIALAEGISLKLPAPFVRIDFLHGKDGLALGEFTPRPGGYHHFNAETDRALGNCFAQAETRLFDDLMAGKRFAEYRELIGEQVFDFENASA